MTNTVFFGPTNAGKSTMIGYLYCQSLAPQQYSKELDEIKIALGNKFRQDRLYSYFVDTGISERIKQGSDKDTNGTSKHTHLKATLTDNGEEILCIDTPGSTTYEQQKMQGISMAKIGVFAIEIQQLISDSDDSDAYRYFNEFFSSWFLWKKMSGLKNTIIVLTKYDLCEGKEDFEEAKSCLSMLLGADDIKETTIIPTSVTTEKSINVNTKLEEDWYKGPSLIEALVEKCKAVDQENKNTPMPLLMFHIKNHRKYEQSNLSQWKILQGMISAKDKIKIAPVELNDKSVKLEDRYISIEASIDSISPYNVDSKKGKYEENAYSGSVNDIMVGFIGEKNCSITSTAIAVKPDEELSIGRCIDLEIRKEDCSEEEWIGIQNIKQKTQLSILWFSRVISVCAKEINSIQSDLCNLKLSIQGNKKIALPKRKLHQQMVMLRLQVDYNIDGNKTQLTTAVGAKVIDIM